MPSCFVPNCTNGTHKFRKKPGISFHRFPKTATKEWLRAIGKSPSYFIAHECICSEHFRKEDFQNYGARKVLNSNVVPSLNIPSPVNSSSSTKDLENVSPNQRERPGPSEVLVMVKELTLKRKFPSPPSTSSNETHSSFTKRKMIETFHSYSVPSLAGDHCAKKELKWDVVNLQQVVSTLKERFALSSEAVTTLENTLVNVPLTNQTIQSQNDKGTITRKKFPPELLSFAMALQFYNTKAYNYVSETFNIGLPTPKTVSSWFLKADCSPGYTQPSFQSLTVRAMEFKLKNNKQLLCALLLEEIPLKRELVNDRYTQRIRGYVDIGCNIEESNELELATTALVLMVVAINDNFKLPVAYFFIDKLTGEEKANLILGALKQLNETGCKIVSVTCDGPQVNFKMMKELGCKVTDPNKLQTYFLHPVTSEKVFVLFDVSHMLKLVRNNWASSKEFVDPDGNHVKWKFIEELYKILKNEDLHLGNKVGRERIKWENISMKVNVAAQTLSSSVADALQFLSERLQLEQFKDVAPTIQFIRIFAQLFDLLNSRNLFGRGMKTPMRKANAHHWIELLDDALIYLQNCEDSSGQPLYETKKRVPFIGFIVSATSLLEIYEQEVIENGRLEYLLTYKFSQDHVELFLCSIRSRNGWIDSPNCQQFMHTYKKLLLHHNHSSTGKCQVQDQTNMLILTKSMEPLTISDVHIARTAETTTTRGMDESEETIHFDMPANSSEYSTDAVSYIAGCVARQLKNELTCVPCIEALGEVPADESDFTCIITGASRSVRYVCSKIETKIQLILTLYDGILPTEDNFVKMLTNESQYFIENEKLFVSLNEHVFDTAFEDVPHKKVLVEKIIKVYSLLRIRSTVNTVIETSSDSFRDEIGKLIIFQRQ